MTDVTVEDMEYLDQRLNTLEIDVEEIIKRLDTLEGKK